MAEREAGLDPDDPINIQYTSGTTGNPKGATLTHHNILNNARSVAEVLGYTEADRVCIPVPLYHCFGMGLGTLGCVASGATMVYPAESFAADPTLDAIAEERCTSIYGVPTMFIAMLESPRFGDLDLSSLRTGIMAGAPCPIEVMKRVVTEMHAEEMTIAYGMTETSPASTMTRRTDDLDRRTSTVGTVLPHVEVKIVDPATGATVPTGTPGELCSRGYLVMAGYWEDVDATKAAVDDGGWMHTGDLAVMDADGYVNIVGRSKDMVIRGGENIYPREIEEVLFQHPAVAAAQVIGVPDPRMGEELMAWVTFREGDNRDRGRTARLLSRAARPLQGAALLEGHVRVPHDRHRQGPEVQDARDSHRRARTRNRRRDRNRLTNAHGRPGRTLGQECGSAAVLPCNVDVTGCRPAATQEPCGTEKGKRPDGSRGD